MDDDAEGCGTEADGAGAAGRGAAKGAAEGAELRLAPALRGTGEENEPVLPPVRGAEEPPVPPPFISESNSSSGASRAALTRRSKPISRCTRGSGLRRRSSSVCKRIWKKRVRSSSEN